MTEKKNELMINKEAQKKLFEKGKKDGTVTLIDIMEAFQDNDMDKGVAENLYETLGNLGIEVVDDKEVKEEKMAKDIKFSTDARDGLERGKSNLSKW